MMQVSLKKDSDIRILHIKLRKKNLTIFNLSASTKQERYTIISTNLNTNYICKFYPHMHYHKPAQEY